MDKNPIIKKPEIEEKEKHQSKRKKRETTCSDKRKAYFHCGICGTSNIIVQGVGYCDKCGDEINFITEEMFPRYPRICDCKFKDWREKMNSQHYITRKKCITCGAVELSHCPACGKSWCWSGSFGEKYCKNCGFRFEGYKK